MQRRKQSGEPSFGLNLVPARKQGGDVTSAGPASASTALIPAFGFASSSLHYHPPSSSPVALRSRAPVVTALLHLPVPRLALVRLSLVFGDCTITLNSYEEPS